MENASKALIIAGAILIAILLITIGIVLINSARGITETGSTAMSSQAIQAFNSQFIQYEGKEKNGKEVRNLIDTIIASNSSHSNEVVVGLQKRTAIGGGILSRYKFFTRGVYYNSGEDSSSKVIKSRRTEVLGIIQYQI